MQADLGIGSELDFDRSVGIANVEIPHLLVEGCNDAIGDEIAGGRIGVGFFGNDGVEGLSLKKQDEKEEGLHGNLVDDRLVDDRLESLLHV